MKYLVIGGAGFQGRVLVESLLKNGGDVRVFDKAVLSPKFVGEEFGRLEYIFGDFNSFETLDLLVQGVDVIFHLISTTLPKTSNEDPVMDVMTNVVPTIHLLECARKAGVRKIIYFSSGGTVYGTPKIVPTPEDHPTKPLCSYGIHKIAIEHYLHLYFTLYGLDYAVMRISNPYGKYQSAGRGQGVVSVFLHKITRNETIEIWGDGSVVRDYIHVDDVIDAAIKLVNHQGENKVFNIGSGKGLTLSELISDMETIIGSKAKITYLPGRGLDVPENVLDIRRAFEDFGWRPQVSIRDGISKLIKDLKNKEN